MSARLALIIANTEYNDPGLAQLVAPGNDAVDFARVLNDRDICAFDEVDVLLNQPSFSIIEAIDEFFGQKKPDDLLVLYFSGHGVRDEFGSLYFAVKNTVRTRLRSTAIKSDYVREAMEQSRSKRQLLVLDCCNSGAFPQGTKAEVGGAMGLTQAFQGYGRFILTASDATQFAWEGNKVIGETDNSLFTHFLVKGLEGEADLDSDGRITVDELYDYAFEQVSKVTPKQTPTKSSAKVAGEIVLRQITRIEDIKPVMLPDHLISEIENPYPEIRLRAVEQLAKLLTSKNLGLARSAREALEAMEKNDDSRRVVQAVSQTLEPIRQADKLKEQAAGEEAYQSTEREDDDKRSAPVQPVPSADGTTRLQRSPRFRSLVRWIIVGMIGLLVVGIGVWGIPYFTNEVPPVATFTTTTTATAATSPTTSIQTPVPTYAPVLSGTLVPSALEKISVENVNQITQLARWNKGRVSNIVYSPRGDSLAVASSTGIYLYDAATYKQIAFIDLNSFANSVAFSPDGQILASGSSDNTVRLWQISDGKLLQTLEGHTGFVSSVAFSPDGQILASGSNDSTIRLWQVRDGTLLRTLQGPTSVVSSVAFASGPLGVLLASGSGDGSVRLWKVNTGALVQTFQGHTAGVNSVAFSPDEKILASGGSDKTIRLWNIWDGTLLKTIELQSKIRSVAFSPDGQTLASGSGWVVRLWSVRDGTSLQTLQGNRGAVNSVIFSPDGGTVVAGGDSEMISFWRVIDGTALQTINGHSSWINSVTFSPNGDTMAASSGDNCIRLWRVSDGNILQTIQTEDEFINLVAFSTDGKILASASSDKSFRLWQNQNGDLVQTFEGPVENVDAVAFSPDGQILASGSDEGMIRLWQVSDGTQLRTLEGHTQWVEEFSFSPDGKILASASGDKTVRLWRVSDGTLLQTLQGHTDSVLSVAFSPDGQTLASASADQTIRFWRVSDGGLLRTLEGHTDRVNTVAFSPNGRILASGAYDNTIRLWQVSDGSFLSTLTGHTNAVESVSFTPNGRLLVSASDDGTIRVWGIKP